MSRKNRPPRPRFVVGVDDDEPTSSVASSGDSLLTPGSYFQMRLARASNRVCPEAPWLVAALPLSSPPQGAIPLGAPVRQSSNTSLDEKPPSLLLSPPPVWNGYHSDVTPAPPASSKDQRRSSLWRTLPLLAGGLTLLFFLGSRTSHTTLGLPSWPSRSSHSWPWHTATNAWVRRQSETAWSRVLANIGAPCGAADGVVIASPSKGQAGQPDYYYTWTRDAALTISSLLPAFLPPAYLRPWDGAQAAPALARNHTHPLLEGLLRSYATAQASMQETPNPSGDLWSGGLSEPKFMIDCSPFTGSWGRPQRDGPALRAMALIPYANWLLDRGYPADIEYVRTHLYDPKAMRHAGSVIKNDLEEVATRWAQPGFDLWEETTGRHLFGDAAARRALQSGANLAARLGDTGASAFYTEQSEDVTQQLQKYFDPSAGYYRATLQVPNGRTGLDSAPLLAVVHTGARGIRGNATDLAPTDPAVLSTLRAYVLSFKDVYAINSGPWTSGWLVGRYAEDVYDGVGFDGGNPWYLTSFTVAQVLYLAAADFAAAGRIPQHKLTADFWKDVLGKDAASTEWVAGTSDFDRALKDLHTLADAYLNRAAVAVHGGRMSEQIQRKTGKLQGARDLTWSYAAFLELERARAEAKRALDSSVKARL